LQLWQAIFDNASETLEIGFCLRDGKPRIYSAMLFYESQQIIREGMLR